MVLNICGLCALNIVFFIIFMLTVELLIIEQQIVSKVKHLFYGFRDLKICDQGY